MAESITLVCPKCGQKVTVDPDKAKGLKCTKCGVAMLTPEKAAVYAKAYAAAKARKSRRTAAGSLIKKAMPAGYGYEGEKKEELEK